MSEKIFATKFLRDEDQIKQDWLCLLMKDENAPLDVTYKANLLKIQKEYYPIAFFDITCEADWSATSYWEHVEEYQVPKEETVYIDYMGHEHSSSGSDTEVRNGRMITHYRKPMSRTVYETKKKTVVDNVQQTSGYVDPVKFTEKVFTGTSNCGKNILGWIDHFNNSQLFEASQDYLKDFTIIQETVSRSSAQSTAEGMARNDIGNVASRDVPGNRYEGLSVSSNILDVQRKTIYIGVYHIFYEYEGKNYNCLMCAGDRVDDVVLGDHPIDDAIKARSDSLQEEISKNGFFSRKTLYLLGAVAMTFICMVAIPMMFVWSSVSSATGYSGLFIVLDIVISLALIGVDAFCINKFIVMNKKKRRAELEKANFNESNAFLKKQIYELIQNDSIPEEGKKETIEGWIKDQFGNYENSDSVKVQVEEEDKLKNKKVMFIVGGVVAAILVLSLLVFVALPAIRYNSAINKIENNQLVEGYALLKKMPNYKNVSEYLNKYESPIPGIDQEVFLRGLELVNVYKSDDFIEEFGQAEQEQLDKDYGKKLADITLKEYAESLTTSDMFNENIEKIDKIKGSSDYDEKYLEAIKAYYYVACDYAIAKKIENYTSTKYYRFELDNHSWGSEDDLGKELEELYDDFYSSGAASLSMGYRVSNYGTITIIGAKFTPDERIDMDSVKYFGESEEEMSLDANASTEKTSTEDASTENVSEIGESAEVGSQESVTWYDFTELTGNVPAFYGIWCVASKNKQEAVNIAQNMVNLGISGQVFYSENWSNLASDGWFIVSAGSYYTEAEANMALPQVKQNYPNAYVKYSGDFIEYPELTDGYDPSEDQYYNVEQLIGLASTREITESDLEGYTSFELSAARNGIYAAHGFVFQTQQWNEFFSSFSWYSPDPTFQQGDVSSLENKNAATIREYEDKTFGGPYTF